MISAAPLATFVHLSDLHIGMPARSGSAVYPDASVSNLVRFHPIFDGLVGHHHDALEEIADFAAALANAGESWHLITSGDLTRNGHPAQYALASLFLGASLPRSLGSIGLAQPDWQERTVPGNHDHWVGHDTVVGGPRRLTRMLFRHLPQRWQLVLRDGLSIEVICVNTDANVDPGPHSRDRWRARGSFVSQLDLLSKNRTQSAKPVVRVMLMHHSVSYQDPGGHGTLEIDGASYFRLQQFLVEEEIGVVLCGHVHTARCTIMTITHNGSARRVLEARCGTSASLDSYPSTWKMPASRTLPANTLLLHRIVEVEARLRWRTWIYERQAGMGFLPLSSAPAADHPLD